MSEYVHKSHNVSVLIYHFVCPAKYRRVVFSKEVDQTLKETCLEISKRYEIAFLEIGVDKNHVHFLIQSVPSYSPTKIIKMIKSITAKEIFAKHLEVKKLLWGGEFWSDGYFVNTVSKFGSEATISKYVKNQGVEKEYSRLHAQQQMSLF
ncbi:MAG: IS200/IS605 family transposase [Candidatus Micrarchaeota archaeon]|nr:IS200/IS605 family transposase [Candidatus Micrarchaeota archaeon]